MKTPEEVSHETDNEHINHHLNPKEKAEQLVRKFYKHARKDSSGFLVSNEDVYLQNAIQCAIICVNEILEAIHFDWMEEQNLESQRRYWDQVLSEIEKMK